MHTLHIHTLCLSNLDSVGAWFWRFLICISRLRPAHIAGGQCLCVDDTAEFLVETAHSGTKWTATQKVAVSNGSLIVHTDHSQYFCYEWRAPDTEDFPRKFLLLKWKVKPCYYLQDRIWFPVIAVSFIFVSVTITFIIQIKIPLLLPTFWRQMTAGNTH